MAAERKIGDEELARLRRLHAGVWGFNDLGEAFGIAPQHAGRLARGEQRAPLREPELEDVSGDGGDVSEAVGGFLSDAELSADQVLARRRAPWPGSSTRALGRIRRRRRTRRLGWRHS